MPRVVKLRSNLVAYRKELEHLQGSFSFGKATTPKGLIEEGFRICNGVYNVGGKLEVLVDELIERTKSFEQKSKKYNKELEKFKKAYRKIGTSLDIDKLS